MTDFPIEIAEKILLLTDNPCKYNRVSKTWYRATKKNNFWYKYVSTRYKQDFGPLFNYYNAWVQSGGDYLDLSKIHYATKHAANDYLKCTQKNLPNLAELYSLENQNKYLKLLEHKKWTRHTDPINVFVDGGTLQIDLGFVDIMLRGPTSAEMTDTHGCFGQMSMLRSAENEKFFKWFVDLETKIEQSMFKISDSVTMKKKISDKDQKWFNLNMHNRPYSIYSSRISPQFHQFDCPVIIDFMPFRKSEPWYKSNSPIIPVWYKSNSPIIPVRYKWLGKARVIIVIEHVWTNINQCYGISISGPEIIFLPDQLPEILQTPFQEHFNMTHSTTRCRCEECISDLKWGDYLDKHSSNDYYRANHFDILGFEEPELPAEEKEIMEKYKHVNSWQRDVANAHKRVPSIEEVEEDDSDDV